MIALDGSNLHVKYSLKTLHPENRESKLQALGHDVLRVSNRQGLALTIQEINFKILHGFGPLESFQVHVRRNVLP